MDWFKKELTTSTNDDGNVEVFSFLNAPDWFYDFMYETFKVISYD